MANLKELRSRIQSVKATQKITRAMQMVAAAKLRRAQEAAVSARPFTDKIAQVVARLGQGEPEIGADSRAYQLLRGPCASNRHLLVVCTAERGLCGGFNSSIARLARRHADDLLREGKSVSLLCVGRKGAEILKRRFGSDILGVIEFRGAVEFGSIEAQKVTDDVLGRVDRGEIDRVSLFYSRFKTVLSQVPTVRSLVPADLSVPEEASNDGSEIASGDKAPSSAIVFEFEPDEETLLSQLLPRNVMAQILRALLENAASEQGARMSAMDSATRNAGEMIDDLTLRFNKTRQAMITKELIEIISGADAV